VSSTDAPCDDVFERFAEVSAQGFVIADMLGKITYANPAAVELISPARKIDLVGKNWFDYYPDNVYDRIKETGLPELERSGTWDDETDIVNTDGRIVQAITSMSKIAGKNGTLDRLAIVVVDISARAKAEYELTMSVLQLRLANEEIKKTQEKLMKAERMASMLMLSGGIAHEINNPLSVIKTNLSILESDGGTSDAAASVKDIFTDINMSVNRIGKIVKSLKFFGDASILAVMPLFVEDALEQAIIMAESLRRENISLVRDYSETASINANQQGLVQVFSAVVINAYQSIDDAGSVLVSTKTQDGQTDVMVTDTGRGMSSVDASRATEPFFTTKPAPDSVGLGLTIAQDIAAKYNGVLRIVSSPGKGTTVSISFPVSEA
jgi:PAS domain S-box-containing protein